MIWRNFGHVVGSGGGGWGENVYFPPASSSSFNCTRILSHRHPYLSYVDRGDISR